MATSDVDICNSALNMIGASTILSLTEDSKVGRICNQRYPHVRDAVFRAHPWNCLIKRTSLPADTTAPEWEFKFAYSLPVDCLRVLRLQYLDSVYKIEGKKIVTDEGAPLKIQYVAQITDAMQYDELLVEAIASRLASDISYPVIGSNTLSAQMIDIYMLKLSEARFVDATEGMPGATENVADYGSIQSNTFINARR